MTSVPPTQPPAAPETDVSALVEALAKHLHERFSPDWAPHWDDLDETEQADSIHADMARSLLEPDGALTALLADLSAARERVRVVEGERDAARAELRAESRRADKAVQRANHYEGQFRTREREPDQRARAESAEAAHRALQAAVAALADAAEARERASLSRTFDGGTFGAWIPAADLRALLAGGAR